MSGFDVKIFLYKLLLFVFLLIIADRSFGLVMDKFLAETNKGDWGRSNYLMNEAEGDVLIMGSSRAIHHYDIGCLSDSLGMKCINAGEDGMGILLMNTRLKHIAERRTPKLVIYEFLPEYDIDSELDNSRYLKFLRPYVDHPDVRESVMDISPNERWKLNSKMYMYNSVFLDIVTQRFSRVPAMSRDFFWAPLKGEFDGTSDSVYNGSNTESDPLKERYLRGFVQICEENGIRLLFVVSPYYGGGTFNVPSSLASLCDEYSIPLLNHFSDSTFVSDPSLFVDPGHLNERGASRFTIMVGEEVKEILKNVNY